MKIFKLKILTTLFLFLFITMSFGSPKVIDWDDLIPWTTVFSPDEVKFNKSLVDKEVKIPGYVLPLDMFGRDINSFLLVPYIGACIHVPPPAPNQIVYVEAEVPWQGLAWWEPVYVTGKIKIETVGPPFKTNEVKIAYDGEILVKGENVMLGYWNMKKETDDIIKDGWLHTCLLYTSPSPRDRG